MKNINGFWKMRVIQKLEGPLEYAELHFIPITVKKSKQVYPSPKPIHILMQEMERIHTSSLRGEASSNAQKATTHLESWKTWRPETQHNFANPGKEKTRLQQYCNWNRQNVQRAVHKAQQAQFHL
jgi:hypothetical protein